VGKGKKIFKNLNMEKLMKKICQKIF
jgi:hypothetical protein